MINHSLKLFTLFLLTLILASGCASRNQVDVETQQRAGDAIASAQTAIDEAAALGAEWREGQSLLDNARSAFDDNDFDTAISLANQAETAARDSIAAMNANENELVADLVEAEEVTLITTETYQVQRGDTLWGIAGRGSIYSNSYMWPLIYRANTNMINDPDLIYPGQNLEILTGVGQIEIDSAVNHARSRGNWSVGSPEESDGVYLGTVPNKVNLNNDDDDF